MAESAGAGSPRLAIIDVARGVAIVAMIVYHALWDLGPDLFGFIGLDAARDLVPKIAARLIAGSFLFLVGVSLVLAHGRGFRGRAFLRRLFILVGAALIVTVATRIALPGGYVRFGILHAIAALSVLGLPFVRAPLALVAAATIAAFVAPAFLSADAFNHPAWIWLGLSTFEPVMVDYVPILPWWGATLLGIFVARVGIGSGLDRAWARWQPTGFVPRALTVAGRWSLAIYLIHQPILLGAMYVVSLAVGRQPTFGF